MATYGGPNYNIGETYNQFINNVKSNNGVLIDMPSDDLKEGMSLLKYNPSLLMVPEGYFNSKLPLMVPTDGTGNLTSQRNGTATYFDKNGLLKTAQYYETRIEFDPVTGEFKGVLVEPEMTNLWTNNNSTLGYTSGDVGNGLSIKVGTVPDAFGPGIDGIEYNFINSSSFVNNGYSIRTSVDTTNSTSMRLCLYIKNPSSDCFAINHGSGTGAATFQFSTLTATPFYNSTVPNSSIEKIGEDTYRLFLYIDGYSGGGSLYSQVRATFVEPTFVNPTTVPGTAIIGLGQFSKGTDANLPKTYSPIITQASQVTRVADQISNATLPMDSMPYGEGTLYCEINKLNSSFNQICVLGSNPEFLRFSLIDDKFTIGFRIDGGNTYYKLGSSGFTNVKTNGFHKLLLTFKDEMIKFYCDGEYISSRPYQGVFNFNDPNLSRFNLNRLYGSISPSPITNIKNFAVFKRAITDEEAISLTTL